MRAKPGRGIVVYFISIIATILCAGTGFATTIYYVDDTASGTNDGSSWQNAFRFLQDALAVSNVDTEIRVAQGIYRPDQNTANPSGTQDRTGTFLIKNRITLKGGYAGVNQLNPDQRDIETYKSILSGDLKGDDRDVVPTKWEAIDKGLDNSHHVISCLDQGVTASIEGFTIRAGVCGSPQAGAIGGGGVLNYSDSIAFRKCHFEHHYSFETGYAYGGAVCDKANGGALFEDCRFEHNTDERYGGAVATRMARFTRCIFSENWSWAGGGAVGGGKVFNGCTFLKNRAGDGGAVSVENATFIGCVFTQNTGLGKGGAVYTLYKPVLVNCVMNGNFAKYGGAICNDWTGAIQGVGGGATLINCTLTHNTAEVDGGGVYIHELEVNFQAMNSIFWGNRDRDGTIETAQIFGSPALSNCCIEGLNAFLPVEGNFADDPIFRDLDGSDGIPGNEDDDLRLTIYSPCIDRGENGVLPKDEYDLDGDGNIAESVPFDAAGMNRFMDIPWVVDQGSSTALVVDLGAYETAPDQGVLVDIPRMVPEGSSVSCLARLTQKPTVSIVVQATLAGDSDIHLSQTVVNITFDPSNYDIAQAIPVFANEDADRFGDSAALRLSGMGIQSREITLCEQENEPYANTILVDGDAPGIQDGSSWTDAYRTLQDALSTVHGNPSIKEIWIAQGTYRPAETNGSREATYSLPNPVNIQGGYAGFGEPSPDERDIERYSTILSGDLNGDDGDNAMSEGWQDDPHRVDNCYTVITSIRNDRMTVLDGVTVTGGHSEYPISSYKPGGIRIFRSNPTIRNCRFFRNIGDIGGGIGVEDYSAPELYRCTFSDNHASEGGGVSARSGPHLSVIECVFEGNLARMYGGGVDLLGAELDLVKSQFIGNQCQVASGGAISSMSSHLYSESSLFQGNSSPHWGGALYSGGFTTTIERCEFIGNYNVGDDQCGGAIGDSGSQTVIRNSRFIGNHSDKGNGGAIYCYPDQWSVKPTLDIDNCLFFNNLAQEGGAFYAWFTFVPPSPQKITNCTFFGNHAERGGGIHNWMNIWSGSANTQRITNCILWGNTDKNGTSQATQIVERNNNPGPTMNFNCVQSWTGSLGGTGNIGFDPLFVDPLNPDIELRDFHLSIDSPCIDMGDPLSDFQKEQEPNGGRINLGAYGNTPEAERTVDSDVDGYSNPQESRWDLDPYKSDTDGDGFSDRFEIGYDGHDLLYDPYNPTTGRGTDLNAANPDTDGDGLNDIDEINLYRTNPINPDSDGDGLKDGEELIVYGTNPLKKDSDGDLMEDGWEVRYQLNPTDPTDGDEDADQDGLINRDEYLHNANPTKADSDGDGMPDAWEVQYGLRPDIDDSLGDLDGDGYSNGAEYRLGSIPDRADSIPLASDLYVDDDAPNDPGPGEPAINDPAEDGSAEHPYDTLQKAVAAALDGYVITVADGLYRLPSGLNCGKKILFIRSQNGPGNCILDATSSATGIDFNGVPGTGSVLEGLTLQNAGIGIRSTNSTLEIRDCVIIGNGTGNVASIVINQGKVSINGCRITENRTSAISSSGGVLDISHCIIMNNGGYSGISLIDSISNIANCLIARNSLSGGQAVYSSGTTEIQIRNCTIADNYFGILPYGKKTIVRNSILWNLGTEFPNTYGLTVEFCDIKGGFAGTGNINAWPMFAGYRQGDYHLLDGSPCIQAGNPQTIVGQDEVDIDGEPRMLYERIDMGCDEVVRRDLTGDRQVDISDLVMWASHWMESGCMEPLWCGGGDMTFDGLVGMEDLSVIAERWMIDPTSPLGRWTMDGNPYEFLGQWTSTVVDDPAFVDASQAMVGSGAVELDGNDAVVVNGFTGITGTAARTCMAWIKTTTGTVAPIVYWGDKNTASGTWDMRVNAAGQLRIQSVGGGGANSVSAVNTGQWVHVVVVLPEKVWPMMPVTSDIQLYVNGVLETGGTVTAGMINTKTGAAMRVGTDEAGKYFTGLIDDVRVYDRALTAEEIAAVMGTE